MNSSRRNSLLFALACAVAAFLFYRETAQWSPGEGAPAPPTASFWGLVVCGSLSLWGLVSALPTMDGGWRLRLGFTVSVLAITIVALWPNLETLSRGKLVCPKFVKDRVTFGIAPGLDLRGGKRFVYTVEVEDAIRDKRDNFADEMRQELARGFGIHSGDARVTREELTKLSEKVRVSTPESAVIRLAFTDKNDKGKVDDRFRKKFLQELSESAGPAEGEISFRIRPEVESGIRDRAVTQAKDTVSRRVDELGLREAAVTTRDEDIIVEVPGQDDKAFAEIEDIIRRTARLEFKMLDDLGSKEVFGPAKIKEEELPEGSGLALYREQAPDGMDSAGKRKTTEAHYVRMTCKAEELSQKDKDRDQALLKCLSRFKEWSEGWAKKVGMPDDHQIGFSAVDEYEEDTQTYRQIGWRTVYLFRRAEVTGEHVTDAQVAQDTRSGMGEYYVSLTMSPTGGDRFEEITGANINRRFAIILDEIIDSYPVIKTKIPGGHAQITMGQGDPDQQLAKARKLELVLRSGALPAPITQSNKSSIGASLGEDAIDKGVKGALAGSLFVLVFMVIYYRKAGVVADVAVLFNLLIQMAVLASFSATMTLPGIAGLALTIGMAVDANVLINERIREELRAGRSVRAAIETGYGKAFLSIFDGHVTVFISGLILAQYGTGPVKGFAVTLIVGILASLFTGVFCTRIVFDWWARGAKVKRLSVGAEF